MQFQESFEHGESPRQQHRNSISNPQGTASPSSFIVLFILCNMIVVFQKDHFSVKKKKKNTRMLRFTFFFFKFLYFIELFTATPIRRTPSMD